MAPEPDEKKNQMPAPGVREGGRERLLSRPEKNAEKYIIAGGGRNCTTSLFPIFVKPCGAEDVLPPPKTRVSSTFSNLREKKLQLLTTRVERKKGIISLNTKIIQGG